MRPAPIQLLYMGFPGSMGADFIDYIVSDAWASPTRLAHIYHEKLLLMPHSYFCNDHRQSFNGPHCGIVPPEAISPQFVAAGSAGSTAHPPRASYEWRAEIADSRFGIPQ